MNPKCSSNIYAVFGLASLLLGAYTIQKTLEYSVTTGDMVGAGVFGLAGVILMVVSVVHFYMAIGYKFGQLERVTGSLQSATLKSEKSVIAEAVKIRFLRKPDADNLNATPENRYVFFISGWRPWVCPESGFLKE
jgi:hypothetical protein